MARRSELFFQESDFEIVNPESSKRRDSLSNFDDIAHILIQEKFILTALEFHAELLENGLELPRLRDYFSNPGNFERPVDAKSEPSPGLPRTSSIQTFDSLDFARYSDDGDRQTNDKLAVLEFELRKAQETIRSLRANLTEAAESEGTSDNYTEYVPEDDAIKLHERRALDYLVNEYLLKNNYKLTSITFSDENSNQDFEDWDDVGLNIPKPPTLLSLYREYGRMSRTNLIQREVGIQVEYEMKEKYTMVDESSLNYQLSDFYRYCGNSFREEKQSDSKFAGSEGDEAIGPSKQDLEAVPSVSSNDVKLDESIIVLPSSVNSSSLYISGNDGLSHASVENTATASMASSHRSTPESENHHERTDIVETLVADSKCEYTETLTPFHALLNELIIRHSIVTDNRLAIEICKAVDSSEQVILLLARCLPHIVPNVILSKREELLPVILCAISLHPDAAERDKLLNLLFNLIKRPDEDQRGFVAIAQLMGTSRVENELLPQCWEQIGHKYPERRILVAEACGVLSPYITVEIRSSLVLSMLQQMLNEEKLDVVRNAIVQSLAILFAYMQDLTKYPLGMDLLTRTLHDMSDKVAKSVLRLLLPSFCLWSKTLGKLETSLVPEIIHQINDVINKSSISVTDDGQHILNHLIEALLSIVPWIFILTIETLPSNVDVLDPNTCDIDVVERLPPFVSPLCNLGVIMSDNLKCNSFIKAYESYTSEEWYESWSSFDWIIKSFLPDLFGLLRKDQFFTQEQTHALIQLFFWVNRMFGRHFMIKHVKPAFRNLLRFNDNERETVHNRISAIQVIVPVYACGILTAFPMEEDRQELTQFLIEVLVMLSLCRLPLTSIEFVITELRLNAGYDDLILSVLWDGVVHSSPLVRASSAILFQMLIGRVDEHILATKIAPALVTLANDAEITVKISTVQTFGCILEKSTNKEMLAKAEMQFQTFLDDPLYKDQFELRKEIIRTLGHVAPISDARFRDEFVLPHLVALANCNNQLHQEVKRTEIALTILDAFIALSGFCTNEKVVHELVIPGLKCLLHDIQELSPGHEEIVHSLLSEFNSTVSTTSTHQRHPSGVTAVVSSGVDEVKSRVGKIFTNRTLVKPNIQNIFSSRKNN